MPLGNDGPTRPDHADHDPRDSSGAPPVPHTDRTKMVAAGVLLALPLIALMWVPSYAKDGPELWGFPFFFWYQFLWVFLCSGLTWSAYKLTLSARRTKGGKR